MHLGHRYPAIADDRDEVFARLVDPLEPGDAEEVPGGILHVGRIDRLVQLELAAGVGEPAPGGVGRGSGFGAAAVAIGMISVCPSRTAMSAPSWFQSARALAETL